MAGRPVMNGFFKVSPWLKAMLGPGPPNPVLRPSAQGRFQGLKRCIRKKCLQRHVFTLADQP